MLYVGRTAKSLGARVSALYGTPWATAGRTAAAIGSRRSSRLDSLRIWWAETDAPEEYEDAVVTAIAETVTAEERAALPNALLLLPWANLESATGEKRATGLTGIAAGR